MQAEHGDASPVEREQTHDQRRRETEVARVGDYSITNVIVGEGVNKVHLGVHVPSGARVAVKVVERRKFKTPQDETLARREIDALRRLRHPNVVHFLDVHETPEAIYLVMEYATGGDMLQYVRTRGRLAEGEARMYVRQLLDALEYVHQNNIVHRDLKPENVLLDDRHHVKLTDFGFCHTDHRKYMNTFCGSHDYAPPEMFLGDEYSGIAVDIWSLGVLIYFLITGRLPFDHGQMSMRLSMLIAGEFTIPDYVSPGMLRPAAAVLRLACADGSRLCGCACVRACARMCSSRGAAAHPQLAEGQRLRSPDDRVDPRVAVAAVTRSGGDRVRRCVDSGAQELAPHGAPGRV